MEVRNLRLASDALARHLADGARQALDAWRVRWGVPVGPAEVAAQPWSGQLPRDLAAPARWLGCGPPAAVAIGIPLSFEQQLGLALFGSADAAPGTLASAARSHLMDELVRVLLSAWSLRQAPAPASAPVAIDRWAAPVEVVATIEGLGALIAVVSGVLCGSMAAKVLGPTGKAGAAAFHSLPVRPVVVVGRAEIPLPEIAALQAGDVIVLDSHIEDPVQFCLPEDAAVLPAFLGCAGGARAAQLTTHSSKP